MLHQLRSKAVLEPTPRTNTDRYNIIIAAVTLTPTPFRCRFKFKKGQLECLLNRTTHVTLIHPRKTTIALWRLFMLQPESTFHGDAERTMFRDSPHTWQSSAMNRLLYEQDPFGMRRTSTDADSGTAENVANTYWEHWYDGQQQESLVADQEAEQRSTQIRQTCQRDTKSICTSTHPKCKVPNRQRQRTEQIKRSMQPRKLRLWWWVHNHRTAKFVEESANGKLLDSTKSWLGEQ